MRRVKPSASRIDLSVMREALKDGRVWSALGVVRADASGNFYELTEDDVLVEVELEPSGQKITARLGAMAGGPGRGVWAIPPIGTEVAVMVPNGEYELGPIIVATLSSNDVPSELDATTIVVKNNIGDIAIVPSGELKLGSKTATQQAIKGNLFQTKFNNFVTAYNAHTHAVSSGPTPVGTAAPTTSQATASDSGDLSTKVKLV
jgi:hypothetical protein